MTYCRHQMEAKLLTCPKCQTAYYVTNAPAQWVCACCGGTPTPTPEPMTDINGVEMNAD